MEGTGKYSWPDGKEYEGSYKDGVKEGQGEMRWPDGKAYIGGWVGGKQSGHGTLYSPEKEVLFEGEWKLGKPVLNKD